MTIILGAKVTINRFWGKGGGPDKWETGGANVCKSLQGSGTDVVSPMKRSCGATIMKISAIKINKIQKEGNFKICPALAHCLQTISTNTHGHYTVERKQFGGHGGSSSRWSVRHSNATIEPQRGTWKGTWQLSCARGPRTAKRSRSLAGGNYLARSSAKAL